MAIVVPDAAERYLLNRMIKGTAGSNNWTLKLYTAIGGTPGEATVVGDFTEATFAGYTAKTLTNSSWGDASTSTGTSSSTYGSSQTFTRSSTGSLEAVLGYYIVDLTATALVYYEAFAATANMANNGDSITFTPKIELS